MMLMPTSTIAILMALATETLEAHDHTPVGTYLQFRSDAATHDVAIDGHADVTAQSEFSSVDAIQGVAVDAQSVYALSSRHISRHDKHTGESMLRWTRPAHDTTIVHLDSGVVHDGRLYTAHSDWPVVPTSSSVEVWRTDTLEHVASHPFGTRRGSFTWLDRYAGTWWGTFTDYGQTASEDESVATDREALQSIEGTRLVEMNDSFDIMRSWSFPSGLTLRFAPMSNSGGSWGPNGNLFLTGHDRAEAYEVVLPATGSVVEWIDTVLLPGIEGQGIAWDRSVSGDVLYGLNRSRHQVVSMKLSIEHD